jgi:TetR/AcrR family transcriptional regulator, cholesterol catabolism regulator
MTDVKDKILHTALEHFLKNGIRDMAVQKLSASLKISTKTFYRYYLNKEELLEDVLRLFYDQQYQILEKVSAEKEVVPLFVDIWYHAVEREHNVNNRFFRELHYYYPELEKKTEEEVGDKFWKKIRQIVLKGQQEGVFQAEIHPDAALEGIAVLYGAVARTDRFVKFNLPPYQIFLNTIILYIRGFCTEKGIYELENYLKKIKPFGLTE